MIQSRIIGDIRITRVLEYAAPTHDPAFLFPDLPQAVLTQHQAWMAPHHWVPEMNRLIVTIQLWVIHAGSNIIVVDTGVGNHKPRAAARMKSAQWPGTAVAGGRRRRPRQGHSRRSYSFAQRPRRLEYRSR